MHGPHSPLSNETATRSKIDSLLHITAPSSSAPTNAPSFQNAEEQFLYERRYVMKAAIVGSIASLRGSSIANIDATVSYIDKLCELTIMKTPVLGEIIVEFDKGSSNLTGVFSVKIDWNIHRVLLANGERHIYLDVGTGPLEESLRVIAADLHQLAEFMKEACRKSNWKRSTANYNWFASADPASTRWVSAQLGGCTRTDRETRRLAALLTLPSLVSAESRPENLKESVFKFSVVQSGGFAAKLARFLTGR
jgi:hypothetical protein